MKKETLVNILSFIFGVMIGWLVCMLVMYCIEHGENLNKYPDTMVVTEATDEYMVFEDANGNRHFVNEPAEDMEIGDFVSVLMDKNGTDIVYDDTIVDWKYSGFYKEAK